ncbi:MAG: aminotransferase class V-fold PLP-dependent enzyme, partial [Actinomycetes bacterium]
MTHYDVAYVRSQFPALRRLIDGRPAAYLDGPGGTQTPRRVLDAVRDYLVDHNANYGGRFATSEETDATIAEAHRAGADFLGCDPAEVSFGANMTTLTYFLAEALGRRLQPGDEIVITALDHEANRSPWLRLAERGVVVREVPVDLATCTLDWTAFEALVQPGCTKVVALGYASNAVGTVNDVARAAAMARAAGAWSIVDAVHYALHG